jgi:hypothetical protein
VSDLVEFLTARLDEDETIALAATPSPWTSHGLPSRDQATIIQDMGRRSITGDPIGAPVVASTYRPGGNADAGHIARHDPARVLREVEAKRRILAWASDPKMHLELIPEAERYYVLTALAQPYVDHPDHQEAWRV